MVPNFNQNTKDKKHVVKTEPKRGLCRIRGLFMCLYFCLNLGLVLGEKGRRIRELTSVVQKRFKFPEGNVELYAEKVNNRGLCAVAQAESLRYKLLGGLAVRRYVHRFIWSFSHFNGILWMCCFSCDLSTYAKCYVLWIIYTGWFWSYLDLNVFVTYVCVHYYVVVIMILIYSNTLLIWPNVNCNSSNSRGELFFWYYHCLHGRSPYNPFGRNYGGGGRM